MASSKTELSFEGELIRLHVEKIFADLGPNPRGVHLILIPHGTSISHWYRAVENQVLAIKTKIGDGNSIDELIIPDDDEDATDVVQSDYGVFMLGAYGIDERAFAQSCVIVISGDDQEMLDHPSMLLLDGTIRVKFDADLAVAAAATCGRVVGRKEAFLLTRMPHTRRATAFRSPRSIKESWGLHYKARQIEDEKKKAKEAKEEKKKPKDQRVVPDDVLLLEDMHGYGPAAEWGLELAHDIEDWRRGNIGWADVDTGILLSGPPGCGKTTFAKALARTLDAHLVCGSYSAWLGTGEGHQGNLLLAMRAAFAEAMKNAPSVLLIDEIDNFVARGSIGNGRSDEWNRGVVNGLLECLDGAVERVGVIVVGATNDMTGIDAALRRPGRLDRHIAIPLPDAKARASILRQHLDVDFDLTCLSRETEGMSGADLERVARDARRRARRERGDVELHHVHASLPMRQRRTPDQLRHIATHEIGHAVVAAALGCRVHEVFIEPDFVPGAVSYLGGGTAIDLPEGIHCFQWYMNRIAHVMGGMAAEQMVFGAHSDGVSVDLRVATDLANQALGGFGMGGSLYSHGVPGLSDISRAADFDPRLRLGIDDLLHDQASRARAVLDEYREAFDELVELLLKHHHLDGATVHQIVSRLRRQISMAV